MLPQDCCVFRYNVSDTTMGTTEVELDQDLVALLEQLRRPVKEAARELIVLELYREGLLSSGRAAEVLGLSREDFIKCASARGIPYFQLRDDELRQEIKQSGSL